MLQDQTVPSATPAPGVAGSPATPQAEIVVPPLPTPSGPYTAAEMYEAAQTARRLIRDQLATIEGEREEVARQLRQPEVAGVDKEGLEARLKALDARIIDLREQLTVAQTREAQAAAMPGSTEQTPAQIAEDRFEVTIAVSVMLAIGLGLPLVIAYARRLWRKSAVTVSLTPELTSRLDSIDRAVEATAIEIERVGEGQRFVTQLLSARASEPAQIPRKDL